MKGKLIDLTIGLNGRQRVTVELEGDFRKSFETLQESAVTVEIKKFRNTRSRTANACFHLLIGKIAEVRGLGMEEVKRMMVVEYGTLARDEDGMVVGFKLPPSVDAVSIYPYVKFFDTRVENGKTFNCYLLFKQTHEMNSAEMARLIDGTVHEAHELGIETDTPEQLEKFKSYWRQAEQKG